MNSLYLLLSFVIKTYDFIFKYNTLNFPDNIECNLEIQGIKFPITTKGNTFSGKLLETKASIWSYFMRLNIAVLLLSAQYEFLWITKVVSDCVWTVFEVHINVLQNNNDLANGYFICFNIMLFCNRNKKYIITNRFIVRITFIFLIIWIWIYLSSFQNRINVFS